MSGRPGREAALGSAADPAPGRPPLLPPSPRQRAAPPPPDGPPAGPCPPRGAPPARCRPAAGPSPPRSPLTSRRPARGSAPFAARPAISRPARPHSLWGVDPDDVEVAVVDALLVFVGVASAAPCSAPQHPAVRLGPAAARHRRRSALLPLLLPQRRRARISARRQGAGPGRRGPYTAGRQEQRSATPRQPPSPAAPSATGPRARRSLKTFRAVTGTVTLLLGAARRGAVQPRRLGSCWVLTHARPSDVFGARLHTARRTGLLPFGRRAKKKTKQPFFVRVCGNGKRKKEIHVTCSRRNCKSKEEQ